MASLAWSEGQAAVTSPKRKRSNSDAMDRYQSPMRIRTDITPARSPDLTGSDSPGTAVSNQLRDLAIRGDGRKPRPDLGPAFSFGHVAAVKRSDDASPVSATSQASSLRSSLETPETLLVPPRPTAPLVPTTPTIRPSDPPCNNPRTISPLPLSNTALLPEAHRLPPPLRRASPFKPPTAEATSPPPPSELVWSSAEITGHNPTDPLDDGYGINGIGFRPTPAIAHTRQMKRKQQVVEWKRREAGEDRRRRSERRERGNKAGRDAGVERAERERRVRFLEG